MEFADNGDLYQKIVEHKKAAVFFEESEIWRILIQMVKGLKALHDLKILHRDLKSANVFLSQDGSAKLGDLNVSKVARRGLGYTQTGTPYYASPEVWKDQPYDNKSDIWSLGCVLYEMITLRPPFRAENMEGLYNKVIKGQFHRIPERFSSDLNTIVKLLIQVQSENRPSCDQILKHPIIMKRIEYFKAYANDDDKDDDQALLKTIKVPKNLLFLSDKLPRSNYEKASITKNKNYKSFSNKLDDTENKECENNPEELKTKEDNVNITHIVNKKLQPLKNKQMEKQCEDNKQDDIKVEQSIKNNNSSDIKNHREHSPKNRKILQPNIKYINDPNNKELPQLKIISSNRNIEQKPAHKIKYIKNNNIRGSPKINDLYKIYAPYLNNNHMNHDRIKMNPNIYYLKNIEKYYDQMQKKRNIPEIKLLPKRKLSPIKRRVIKLYY